MAMWFLPKDGHMIGSRDPGLPEDFLELFLLLLLSALLQRSALVFGAPGDCVKLPRPPVHGRLVYVGGTLSARLKCSKPGFDLPVDVPADGNPVCDPTSKYKTPDFDNVPRQTCLSYRKPATISAVMTLAFMVQSCDWFSQRMILSKVLGRIAEMKCTWTAPCKRILICKKSVCGKSFSFKPGALQLDVMIALQVRYDPKVTIQCYLNRLAAFEYELRDYFKNKVSIPDAEFQKLHMTSWNADCPQDQPTTGTSLAKHRIASCRGCSKHHVLDRDIRECIDCPTNTYTTHEFASICSYCQPKKLWRDLQLWKKTCLREG